jgi:hypothetical protein
MRNKSFNLLRRIKCLISDVSPSIVLWVNYVDVAPVIGRGAAFRSPVRVVAHVIWNLSRPSAAKVTIEEIALHWCTESRSPAGYIDFPARAEAKCAAQRIVDAPMLLAFLLESLDVAYFCDPAFF